jgi:hypothetical protein
MKMADLHWIMRFNAVRAAVTTRRMTWVFAIGNSASGGLILFHCR